MDDDNTWRPLFYKTQKCEEKGNTSTVVGHRILKYYILALVMTLA
jgi:hypothetical protein